MVTHDATPSFFDERHYEKLQKITTTAVYGAAAFCLFRKAYITRTSSTVAMFVSSDSALPSGGAKRMRVYSHLNKKTAELQRH
ncbi:Hypothetical protein SMAX5B_003354 [Scophthalmus maximus]|uniref:Uncharacterized protein n=1 Tax=Scophthalmus maximus TaxID=52904 RepID=A0A2U9BHU2_SCOMX|nr:Hypothetical protein SMAX5B_003354 [Scophthalmus maximus]